MVDSSKDVESADIIRESFIGILFVDVMNAMERRMSTDDQSSRRELVRTLFAAIEGLTWTYREHIIAIASAMDELKPAEELVFSEMSYVVTSRGDLVEQARFIPMLPMIRLTTNLATRINPDITGRFEEAGWNRLRQALEIRNRLIHPKSKSDLVLEATDIRTCHQAFDWLSKLCVGAMDLANLACKQEASAFRSILGKLKQGDPETTAEYRATAASISDD